MKLSITRLEVIAFIVGMAILTFELTAARVVSPYLGDTIYTWTSIIGVILAALAFGYYTGGILADRRKDQNDIVLLLCVAAVLIAFVNFQKDGTLAALAAVDMPLQLRALVASLLLFALPTFVLGIIAPYLARLSIHSVATSGRHLSRIDAASTLGSLVGTFLTGYWLFGLVGSRNLLSGIALSLALISILIPTKKFARLQIGVMLVVLLTGLVSSKPLISGYVRDIDTAYSKVVVRDLYYNGHTVRALQSGGEGLQSGVYTDGTPGQPFAYIRGFVYASELRPEQDKYLIIGGGAFTFPEYLARQEPRARVDTVEIDDQLPEISREYFDFSQPQNLSIIHDDGRSFLNKNGQTYSMIFLDAFNATVPPFQLLTREAMARAHDSLSENGVMVINLISAANGPESSMLQHVYSTVRSEFPEVSVFQVGEYLPEERQNLLLIASKQRIRQDELDKIAANNQEFAGMLQSKLSIPFRQDLIMTDDFAPVERAAR